MDRNGSNRRKLTSEPGLFEHPSVLETTDSLHASEVQGRRNIWRMEIDGGHQIICYPQERSSGRRRRCCRTASFQNSRNWVCESWQPWIHKRELPCIFRSHADSSNLKSYVFSLRHYGSHRSSLKSPIPIAVHGLMQKTFKLVAVYVNPQANSLAAGADSSICLWSRTSFNFLPLRKLPGSHGTTRKS